MRKISQQTLVKVPAVKKSGTRFGIRTQCKDVPILKSKPSVPTRSRLPRAK